jgi:hypothetical protein
MLHATAQVHKFDIHVFIEYMTLSSCLLVSCHTVYSISAQKTTFTHEDGDIFYPNWQYFLAVWQVRNQYLIYSL